jgi:methylated-DNA-[protein]-cysteine S-methyltransferase
MTEGAFVPSLGLHLLVEWSGQKAKRIYLSREIPAEPSELADRIAAYLEKGAPCPAAELDLSTCTEFQKRIYTVVQGIMRGETMTYGEVAARAGCPRSARAVGRAMATNPFVILVPCHRVVARKGLGGFAWGLETKERMLMQEKGQLGKGVLSKVIEYRDLDYESAKKEVAGYFLMKGEAFASDASTDLQLDYELVCKIMDDLEKEGKMETIE